MPLLVPNNSEITLLQSALGVSTPNNQILRLFVNDYTPVATDVAANYTEMSTLGYASKTLTKTSWSVASTSGSAVGTYAAQTWTFTAGTAVTVYGYYVTDAVSGLLLWAERFNSGKVVQFAGDQIVLTPTISLTSV